jgi:hypothetical protein
MYVATESHSRYGLLGAMGSQLALAVQRQGVCVNLDPGGPVSWTGRGRAGYVFFNHPGSVADVVAWAGTPADHERAVVQWCVDHPLTISAEWLEAMSRDPGFRLLTVTDDDSHLLRMRFPALKQATLWHGVDPGALCEAGTVEESHARMRDIDVLVAGSIASREELEAMRARLPQALHRVCEDIVALRLEYPAMSFGQAVDVAMPSGWRSGDEWRLMAAVFAYTTSAVGRARRIAAVRALRGFNVVLVGTEAWKVRSRGTHRYAGNVPYAELPALMRRARVCLAVSPPQFATGFSERVLLSMAAGCATVAEERLGITREFCRGGLGGGSVRQYPADRPELARTIVEKLLGDAGERAMLGAAGRAVVAAGHLWDHRVEGVVTVAGMKVGSAETGAKNDAEFARSAA